jgi:hypothetical protein
MQWIANLVLLGTTVHKALVVKPILSSHAGLVTFALPGHWYRTNIRALLVHTPTLQVLLRKLVALRAKKGITARKAPPPSKVRALLGTIASRVPKKQNNTHVQLERTQIFWVVSVGRIVYRALQESIAFQVPLSAPNVPLQRTPV